MIRNPPRITPEVAERYEKLAQPLDLWTAQWRRRASPLILPTGTMLLASRGVFGEQLEPMAYPQKLNSVARVVRLSCGICTGLGLAQIVARSTHVSDSAVLIWDATQKEKTRFGDPSGRRADG